MAGILFSDKNMVLAGFNQKQFKVTGLGGKARKGEWPTMTAVREVVEELFEIKEPINEIVLNIHSRLCFDNTMFYPDYAMFVMNFNDLNLIMNIIQEYPVTSAVYESLPSSLIGLIMTRKSNTEGEISHLALLPCSYNLSFDPTFVGDVNTFKNCASSM